jgi:hypothetical protein
MDYSYIPKEILELLTWKQDKKQPGDPDQIVAIKFTPKPCEDCGVELNKPRTVRMSVSQNQVLEPHTKHHCQYCKLYKNPQTGEWDCTFHDVNNHFKVKKIVK